MSAPAGRGPDQKEMFEPVRDHRYPYVQER